ncbi:TAXI family TRAP transporter solute-binding subunit [Bacillus sp. B190/17]|uniref:TAXI family TRAP transporter solute-binding subunit n=1 Tax=Bacillus lumedeiriae TaxID=3058829 RepID=A0ABW8IA71_9BACI
MATLFNNKVKKMLVGMASLGLSLALLSGCGNEEKASGKEKAGGSEGGVVSIGTHPVGIAYHSAGAGIAKVVSENSSVKMIVSPFAGSSAWMSLLNKGEIETGITAKPGTQWAFNGEHDYKEKNKNVRLLVKGNDIVASGLTVREDSGIKNLKDLKGKRIASGYSGDSIIPLIFEAQLKSVGLSLDDVKVVPVADVGQGLSALRENRVDAAFTGTPTVASFLEADNAVGLRAFNFGGMSADEIDKVSGETIKEMQSLVPGIELTVYKGGFVKEDTVLVKYPIALVASADLSDDQAYEIVKTLWKNHKELHPIFGWLETWTPKTMLDKDPLVPYHPGVVRFLKEEGVWTDELEQKQKELLEKAKQ